MRFNRVARVTVQQPHIECADHFALGQVRGVGVCHTLMDGRAVATPILHFALVHALFDEVGEAGFGAFEFGFHGGAELGVAA